ncbi:MAG: hypothetical protein ACREMW_03105 [Gemmatimonadales bacterium]
MKPLPLVGCFVVFRGLTCKSQSDVVKIGELEISAEQRRAIPTWVGVVSIVGGVLLVAGMGRRRGG